MVKQIASHSRMIRLGEIMSTKEVSQLTVVDMLFPGPTIR